MPQATVAAEIHEALDVHGNLGAQITLHLVMGIDDLPNGIHLSIRKVIRLGVPIDAGLIEDLFGRRPPNAVDVCQSNLDALVLR
jgi:hypothetical protein